MSKAEGPPPVQPRPSVSKRPSFNTGSAPQIQSRPKQETPYLGFANLPNQVHRKSVKKGFEFTLMIIGESGLGKSTLVHSLFMTDLYESRHKPTASEMLKRTIQIDTHKVDIEEKGIKLKLTVVDTPGYGDAIDNSNCWEPIVDFVDQQYDSFFQDESGLNRKNMSDTRVHCVLHFINPQGHGLKPLDIKVMKALHHKVNIVPIIAKADTLTLNEVKSLKQRILDEIDDLQINVYNFPECDSDDDETFLALNADLKASVPFAVVGSNTVMDVKGKKVRGRTYPWGVIDVENPEHSDFTKLRNMLIRTHMQDLKDVTQDVHYENYRSARIANGGDLSPTLETSSQSNGSDADISLSEKDKQLREKEAELLRMQEMIAKMQEEMNRQKQGQ
ncbi:septin-2-like isoform X1 [Paramuricea clavata]|uniref:Septin n=1 Tax=Paramuricea clavata TaxID=317549 RepID=A0A7D9J2A3_PARCT|nr:septin-2-like isoform X1 [Paramuricea clavata]